MRSSSLSPILSKDSSASTNYADYASGQDEEMELPANEEQRRLLLARSQCRTPSTGSQVSELSDEQAGVAEQQQQVSGAKQQRLGGGVNNVIINRQLTFAGSGKTSSGSNADSSLASQYLIHANNNQPHQYSNNNGASVNQKKFRQIIQSIPLPLIATIIMTVFILCLLLSECKSLQVSPKSAMQSSLLVEPDTESGLVPPAQLDAPVGEPEGGGAAQLSRRADEAALTAGRELGDDEEPFKLLAGQLARKGELIYDLIHQKHQVGSQANQQEHHVANKRIGAKQRRTAFAKQANVGDVLAQSADSLSAKLRSPGADGGPEATDSLYIDGEAGEGVRISEADGGAGNEEAAVANLRSSELDLSDEQQAPGQNQRYSWQQQQHFGSGLNVKHHNNNHRQFQHHRQQQQQQQQHHQHQQQQQHLLHNFKQPTAEDQMKLYQHLSNNHDRPFDVAQIQCNNTEEGFERFACPSPDRENRYRCIEDRLFCDGYYDCPNGEDEERVACMYYKLKQNRQNTH